MKAMNPKVVKVMTIFLFLFFMIQVFTGISLRFGWNSEAIQQTHSITGMIFMLLVFFHWYLFGRLFVRMLRNP